MFLPLLLEIRKSRNVRRTVFSPTPRNWRELERPVDVFTHASRNKKKQERPGNVFTPTPRNWRELERPVDVFSPTP